MEKANIKKPENGDVLVITNNGLEITTLSKGSGLDKIAAELAETIKSKNPTNKPVVFLDWGGVFSLLKKGVPLNLDPDVVYWIYSFTPANKVLTDLEGMIEEAFAGGLVGLVILTLKGLRKKEKTGKPQVLNALVDQPGFDTHILYYEDTAEVLDNVSDKVEKYWVRPLDEEFRAMTPKTTGMEWIDQEEFVDKFNPQ